MNSTRSVLTPANTQINASISRSSFGKLAGSLAILAGIAGFLYSLSFIVITRSSPALGGELSGLFLLIGGLLSSAALVALYKRLETTDAAFALWALILGTVGALGGAIHGAYDLANALNPPANNLPSLADLPSQVDPRGMLTFGAAGISLLVFSWLIRRKGSTLPIHLGTLGLLVGLLLIVIYLGRLIILDATSLVIVIPALLTGFVLNPLWYMWLGLSLRRE